MDLDLGVISEAEKRQKKKLLLDYLYSNLKNHNFWAYRYFFCEVLALLNLFGNIYTACHFLHHPDRRRCCIQSEAIKQFFLSL